MNKSGYNDQRWPTIYCKVQQTGSIGIKCFDVSICLKITYNVAFMPGVERERNHGKTFHRCGSRADLVLGTSAYLEKTYFIFISKKMISFCCFPSVFTASLAIFYLAVRGLNCAHVNTYEARLQEII